VLVERISPTSAVCMPKTYKNLINFAEDLMLLHNGKFYTNSSPPPNLFSPRFEDVTVSVTFLNDLNFPYNIPVRHSVNDSIDDCLFTTIM